MKKSTADKKAFMISSIINRAKIEVEKKNKELVEMKKYQEQVPFDAADMFFTLSFMNYSNLKKLYNKIFK